MPENQNKDLSKEPTQVKFSITSLLENKYPDLYGDTNKILEPSDVKVILKNNSSNISVDQNEDYLVETDELSEIEHDIDHSAFELNFAEFPIAHLSQRLPEGIDRFKINYSDFIRGRDGVLVERNWTVKSSADHGLGGPSSISVLMELMQIWKEQGFEKDRIYIGSYYNLLKRLGWNTGGSNYKQLDLDLKSLYGLSIEAENAYYDKEMGRYVDRNIKPFIGWAFYKEHQIKDYMTDYGYIQVNQEFFESFKKKSLYYLPFDGSYFRKLNSQEQKLALYLTKIFNPYRKKIQYKYCRNIEEICTLLPIYGKDKYKRKYYLIKTCNGLIKKDFILLENFEINEDQIIFYNKQQTSLLSKLNPKAGVKTKIQIDLLIEDQLKVCGDIHSKSFYTIIAKLVPDDIIFECLSEAKQEGKEPKKLYTKLMKEKGKKYLNLCDRREGQIDVGDIDYSNEEEYLGKLAEFERHVLETMIH